MLIESETFKNELVTGIHSLLDEKLSDSFTEEFSMFVIILLQLSELFRKNSNEICLQSHNIDSIKSDQLKYHY